MDNNFSSFGLPVVLLQALDKLGFKSPTPVQFATIPVAMTGKDVLGSAHTGAGKTAAFGIPLAVNLISNAEASALVMTPTRELATQVMRSLSDLLGGSAIKTALLIGGDSMEHQLRQLRLKPRLYVGTPGRINDHLMRGSLNLRNVGFLVLDEADRMLDMGFSVQIERICKHLPSERQSLLFSATLPRNIMRLAETYLSNYERVAVGSTINPAENIKQEVVFVDEDKKYSALLDQLRDRSGSVIVFVKTKYSADRIANSLSNSGHDARAIHGDLRHNKRERVMRAFRQKRYRVLVATDIAARGLDIPHIQHVINYDLPHCPEDYIHRVGRTARGGSNGEALCLVSRSDRRRWYAIDRFMKPDSRDSHLPLRRGSSSRSSSGSASKAVYSRNRSSFGGQGADGRASDRGPRRQNQNKNFSQQRVSSSARRSDRRSSVSFEEVVSV
ncbi:MULTISPECIES: DEAD/DEAH box helicase [Candidatus Ichthyocystis]|uniref:DEAD-box ATP-dependent RNA helicase CshA n=1 Tax=Candidatus Ichthyocystis hellenicum TaxID=1561003 RepID=A0A0S4M4L5_9BURK|nr:MULTISPECIES: DEAD/DEAH box helicase [Ichthyocystis]CUT17794.1 DEAD-box ATP-dependent RNA helicase CshA [Candidatus Ichthyocystis hellenicum]